MKNFLLSGFIIAAFIFTGCSASRKIKKSSAETGSVESRSGMKNNLPGKEVDTKNVSAGDVVSFAETLIGIRYKYGAESESDGFDCSGFVNYVFNHFNISVPRVTTNFTTAGEEIPIKSSRPGDIILFTGSNANSGVVGHIGIITENDNGDVKFIHASTSRGVMISGMNSYFAPRFIKVNRIFPAEN